MISRASAIVGGPEQHLLRLAVEADDLADLVAEMVPVGLREIVDCVMADIHAACGDLMQQRLPQMRAGPVDQRDLRAPRRPSVSPSRRREFEAAGAPADDEDALGAARRRQEGSRSLAHDFARLDRAGHAESARRARHSRQTQVAAVRVDRDRKPRHIQATLLRRELARLEAHDVGLRVREDLRQSRNETELVAARDGDAVGHADPCRRGRIEAERHHVELCGRELGQGAQARFDLIRRDPVGQVADGAEFRSGAERGEARVAQAHAGIEQFAGDRGDETDLIVAEQRDEGDGHARASSVPNPCRQIVTGGMPPASVRLELGPASAPVDRRPCKRN